MFALWVGGAFIAGWALSQEPSHGDVWQRMLQDAYAAHLARVRAVLPAHSGIPPLLDLSNPKPIGDYIDKKWEKEYKGLGFSRGINDPGVKGPSEATSIATTFLESVGRTYALPGASCPVVIVGRVNAAESRIDCDRKFVYSRFSLVISKVLKGKRKNGIRDEGHILAVQLGGRVLFPSGHMTTFILPHDGFLTVGSEYLLFIWEVPGTKTYLIAEPYLIQNNLVFPISTEADVSAYESGIPFQQFKARVEAAIAKHIDTD